MLELTRAWDIAHEDMLVLDPDETLSSAVEKLLKCTDSHTPCGIVQDKNGRFLGTLSTHRALRAIGNELQKQGVFASRQIDLDKATQAVCHVVGGHLVRDHMYTKALEVSPRTTVQELLAKFSSSTAHFAVVTEAGHALGLLELDDIFKLFAQDMADGAPAEI